MSFEQNRRKQLRELTISTHMVCFVIYSIAFLTYKPIGFTISWVVFFFSLFFIYSLIIKHLESKTVHPIEKIGWFDLIYLLLPFLLGLAVIYITGLSSSAAKPILLLPVIIAAITYGRIPGCVLAGTSILLLISFDMFLDSTGKPGNVLDLDIMLGAIMLLTGWVIGGLTDIEKEIRIKLTELANKDDLTGLYNHRYFQENFKKLIKKAAKNKQHISLILMDIDMFKLYNDTFGHKKGDEALAKIGTILKDYVIPPSFSARYGGEEFAIVLVEADGKEAKLYSQRIAQLIESAPFYGAERMPMQKLTVSMGISTYPNHGETTKELFEHADDALYKAKFMFKDRVQVYYSVFDLLQGKGSSDELINTIKTLITIVNAKDRYTYAHSERVLRYSLMLAKKLNMTSDETNKLVHAAYLHDIGKIDINSAILNKREQLTENEWKIMQKHPVWGQELIQSIDSLKEIAPLVLYHHENYDGSGYPEGLSKDDIPLGARILRIADSFDAMTTNRPYKKAKSFKEACREIEKFSGSWFDPELSKLFLEIIKVNFRNVE